MKSGLMFSLGFTIQRAILTTLGFLGLAAIYLEYNLNGPVYVAVGVVMFIAGAFILKGKYIHLPLDALLHGRGHHTSEAERLPLHEMEIKPIPSKMAVVHGLIAGWGFGAYSTIITFTLAPQVPSLIYAPLPGLFFGLGTMSMQIVLGAVFANIMRVKRLTEEQIKRIGGFAAARTLYLGGIAFAVVGALIIFFPILNNAALGTGIQIPNLDSIGIASVLVIVVVGFVGFGSMYKGFRQLTRPQPPEQEKASVGS
jgi:hypothetical protein